MREEFGQGKRYDSSERNDIINYADKSHSREYRNISRSRSGSIETLIQQYNMNQRYNEPEIKNEMSFKIASSSAP